MSLPRKVHVLSTTPKSKRTLFYVLTVAIALLFARSIAAAQARPAFDPDHDRDRDRVHVMWIDHLVFLPGDPSVHTSFNAVNSGVGGGLSGLIITSSTTGNQADGGGGKVVETALEVPPGFKLIGVRTCYENSNPRSFIDVTRLAQVQNPPSTALVIQDDPTPLNAAGPVCTNGELTLVDPAKGSVLLDFRLNFGDTSDKIVLRAVGLLLVK